MGTLTNHMDMRGVRTALGNIGPNVTPTQSKVGNKEDFLPSIYARLYSCQNNCNDSLYIRRAGEVYCYTCCAPASRAANIDSSPPPKTERSALDQSRVNDPFASPSMPLAASMLEPNDDVDDEVSIAPRHRAGARATATAADTPELKAGVSNVEAVDLKSKVSTLERDLGLAQGVNAHLQKSLDEFAQQSLDSSNKILKLEEKQHELTVTLQQEKSQHVSLQDYSKSLEEEREKVIARNAKRNAELGDETDSMRREASSMTTALKDELATVKAEMARVVEKMTGEAAILELELHEANEAKQQLLNEVTEVRIEGAERAADIEGAVEDAKTEAQAAREEVTMAEDRCLTLDKRVIEIQQQVSELSSTLKATRKEKQDLVVKLDEAALEFGVSESLATENAQLRTASCDMAARLQQLTEDLARSEEQLSDVLAVQTDKDTQVLQLQELQSTWRTEQTELLAQVNQLQLDLQTTNQHSEIELNTEQVKFEALQAELGQLKEAQSAHQVQLSEQQTRVAELELNEVLLKKTIEEKELQIEQSKHAAEVAQADIQIAHSTLDAQVTDLQARLNECQDKLEASCEESSAMQSSAEASLNKVKAVSETLVGENAELVVANKAMTQQVDQLEAALLTTTEDAELKLMAVKKSSDNKDQKLQQLESSQTELTQLRHKHTALEAKMSEQQMQCEEMQLTQMTLKKAVDEKDAQLEQSKHAVTEAREAEAQLLKAQSSLQEAHTNVESLQQKCDELEAAEGRSQMLETELDALQEQHKQLEKQHSELTEVNSSLQEQLEESIKKAGGGSSAEVTQLKTQLRNMEQQQQESDRQGQLQAKGRELEQSNHQLEVRNMELKIDDLTQQLARCQPPTMAQTPSAMMPPPAMVETPSAMIQAPVAPASPTAAFTKPAAEPVAAPTVAAPTKVAPIVKEAPTVAATDDDPLKPREAPADLNPREKMLFRKQERQRIEDLKRTMALNQAMEEQHNDRMKAQNKTRGEFHQ